MDISPHYSAKFKVKPTTRDQGLATEIFESFNRKITFPRIIGIISRTGYQATFEAWKAAKQDGVKNPCALFLWRCRKNAEAVVFTV